jgi:WD40 repeat protein
VTDINTAGAGSTIYLLPDHIDHKVGPYTPTATYPLSDAVVLAQVRDVATGDWKYYMSQAIANLVVEIDSDGQWVANIAAMSGPLGIVPYPPHGDVVALRGHLFVSDSSANIWDVDPLAPSQTLFLSSVDQGPDGLCFDRDGSTLYAACALDGYIKAFDTVTKALVWQSPTKPGYPDGIAIGIGPTLEGYVFFNYNSGDVWAFGIPGGPHAGEEQLIAEGGTRGDFIAVDPNSYSGGMWPSLLLTQTESIWRLDPPGGGWFGPPTSSTERVWGEFGDVYCIANANSTGAAAEIRASGSLNSSAGALRLESAPVPNQFGVFFHGSTQTQVSFGNGFLCTTGGIVRGAVMQSSANVATYTYDNSDPKHSVGAYVGGTRDFQYWFRDPMGGGAAFNTSDAIALVIAP